MESRLKDTLLLVGDAASDRSKLSGILEDSFYLLEAESIAQGVMLLKQNIDCVAAVLADVPLAGNENVYALMDAAQPGKDRKIPVVFIISPLGTGEREEMGFVLGAADVVIKPYTEVSVLRRVQILVDLYRHQLHLEKLVNEQNKTIRNAYQTMIDTVSAIIESRSSESGNHVLRIRRFTQILLQEVERNCPEYQLSATTIDTIVNAAALHDIGKIAIPDAILNKPGRLTDEQFEVMKTHCVLGSQLVERLSGMGEIGDMMFLRYAYNIALYHHERWDGKGYPMGLKGDDIPICAQAVSLADAFDALTTPRVYKEAYPHEVAFNMILNGDCGQFSPKLLECFKHVYGELVDLAKQYADGRSAKNDAVSLPLPGPSEHTYALDAPQLFRLKYQTMLHYVNDTVIELDLINRFFHVVYSPNPSLNSYLATVTFDGLFAMLTGQDPAKPNAANEALARRFFAHNEMRKTYTAVLYNPELGRDMQYQVSLMRVNADNAEQHIVLAIVRSSQDNIRQMSSGRSLKERGKLTQRDLLGALLCCKADPMMTFAEGAESMLRLTGYTPAQIAKEFGCSLMAMVLPEDRERLKKQLASPDIFTGALEAELRLKHREKGVVWALMRLRFHVESNGSSYYYIILTDISVVKESYDRLEAESGKNKILIEQTEGIVFEWDLETDAVSFSAKWEERFGYQPRSVNFSRQIRNSGVHPDDIPLMEENFRTLRQTPCTVSFEARIANNKGRYLWCDFRATSIAGGQGIPARIVGIIHDISDLKNEALAQKKQASTDSLTGLLNKGSIQSRIQAYLTQRDQASMAALLMLDLDNFKTINDSYGHMYGDAILSQVSTALRRLFRANDFIGRVGGDEFMVFLKDIPDREVASDRCALVVDVMQKLLHRLTPTLDVSVSVGCSLVPYHGSTFEQLFRHADEALYTAKRNGKNTYRIYTPRDKYDDSVDTAKRTTAIDSTGRSGLNNEALMYYLFSSLYQSRDLQTTISEILAFIGAHFNVSRVYIFENNAGDTHCSNTFEWCNEGVEPAIDGLQNLSYEEDLPGWRELYERNPVLHCSDITELDPIFQAILEPQGVKSMLHCAILEQGRFRGFIGFDDCTSNYMWTQEQVSLLKYAAEVLSMFLIVLRKDKP